MSGKRKRCAGTNAQGEPCGARAVGEDGFCAAHRPGGRERMRRLGLKGAIASRRDKGLSEGELGPLRTHEDAKRWLELVGRAVAEGRLPDRAANAAIKAVSEWVKTESAAIERELVEQLRDRLDELEAQVKRGKIGVAR